VLGSKENAAVPRLDRHRQGIAYVSFQERLVIQIRRSAIVGYSAAQMYALVNDIDAYPRRFAWCANASVLTRDPNELTARLELRVAGMSQGFTTRNRLEPPQRIVMHLVEGPFRTLTGEWNFTALGDAGCKVSLALDFDYSGRLMAPVMRMGFEKLADRLVDEFCREAERAYA
jgi:ribosome-associated toxin RatA of RatAB toxin-antitoxin module